MQHPLLVSLIATAIFAASLSAQQGRASIFGRVADPSGSGVPDAEIQVFQKETNLRFMTVSTSDGSYSLPALAVGQYRVEVAKSGFKRAVRMGINLSVDQRAQVDLQLEIGAVADSIEITTDAPLVDTGSATVGKVIENKRIQELPLNGRNALALVLLTPGVKSQAGGNSSGFADRGIALSSISINGGPSALNNFVLDGGTNTQGYLADVNANPTVDAVQEFKVQSAVMSAEYGFTAGGVINVVTKSGTNQYHGSVYHFFRNDKLDARNAFAATKAPFRYNQFGGTIGGPLGIPKLYRGKDRTFFFYNYEDWRYARTTNVVSSTPIDTWRGGDFSNYFDNTGRLIPIYNTLTTRPNPAGSGAVRDLFVNNVIPASLLDKSTVAFLRFYPAPNRTPTNSFSQVNNFLGTVKENRDMQQHTVKLDHRFSDKNSIYARYLQYRHYTDGANNGSVPWPDPLVRARYDQLQNKNFVLNDTQTFAPTLLNETRVSVSRSYFPFTAASFGANVPRTLGLSASIPSDTIPSLSGTGYSNFGATTVGIRGSLSWQIFDMVTWVKSSHTIKAGYDHRLNRANNFQRENPSHAFNFGSGLTTNPQSPAGTGAAFATFLLGQVSSATGFRYSGESESAFSSSIFLQDDWRFSRRLTINLGLRWDYQQWPVERYNGLSNFNPNGTIPGTSLKGTASYAGVDYGRSPFSPKYSNFGPRVGLAYDLFGGAKTVLRAGYSIFYPSIFYRDTFGNTAGFANTTTAYVPPGGDANLAAFKFGDGLPYAPTFPLGAKLGPSGFLSNSINYDQGKEKVPMSQQWTASLQHQIAGWLVDLGYSGNHATNLVAGSYSLNDIPLSAWSLGTQLQDRVTNPYAGVVPGSLGAATITRQTLLRPYPYYTGVTARNPHLGNSIYHALLLSVEKRFSKGFVFLASYTRAKLISDSVVTPVNFGTGIEQVGVVGYQNGLFDRRAERSLDPTDVAQRLVMSGIYQLPFQFKQRFIQAIAGGWQINNITTLQTGQPLTIRGANNQRADRPNSTGVSAASNNPSAARWFNTDAFVNPPSFTLGNVGRALPDVRAPGLFNMDLSLIKETRIGERLRLQVRAEAFNVLNHTNLAFPNMSFGAGADGKNNNAAFATITSARDARIGQVALKLIF